MRIESPAIAMLVRRRRRAGMTLLELVIVLGLLVAMASVALTTLDGMGDRSRADVTRGRLECIKKAVVGDAMAPGRFLSDMGRLPVVQTTCTGTNGCILSELWEVSNTSLQHGTVDYTPSWPETGITGFAGTRPLPTTINLSFGWNGPYIDVSQSGTLFDGFGNDFWIGWATVVNGQIIAPDPTIGANWTKTASPSVTPIGGVMSVGRNGAFDTSPAVWSDKDEVVGFGIPKTTLTVRVMGLSAVAGENSAVWSQATGANAVNGYVDIQSVAEFSSLVSAGNPAASGAWTYYTCQITIGGTQVRKTVLYRCVTAGTVVAGTDNRPPNGQTAAPLGAGVAAWEPYERRAEFSTLRVAVFLPVVTSSAKSMDCILESLHHAAISTDNGEVLIDTDNAGDPLVPGVRKLYAYGFIKYSAIGTVSGDQYFNRYGSGVQTIELKPGANYVTVYLTEPLE